MNRIEALYSFISEEDKVVDVGCDQAKLGLMLASRGQKSIASDRSLNVIDRARHDLGRNKYIDLRVSDGLDNINEGEADTLVLAGMGTHTMLEILNKTSLRFKKIITISNNYHNILREKMNELNYKVDSELIVYDMNKYYNLIVFVPGNREYSEKELLLGVNHVDLSMYIKYIDFLRKKYTNIKETSKDKNEKVDKMLEHINSL
ncbi:MAG: SAM-dependent methyltransferase [Bacilli bacterium]|nr:SAM-dependent methyltransferase [Bacilli bacterium]